MPVFTDALLGDTMHLSAEEFGAYMLLLFTMWRNNGRPLDDDDLALSRICRVSIRRWREKLRPRLIGFFEPVDNSQKLSQKRLVKEWCYIQQRSETARANALSRWHPGDANASDQQADGNASAYATHTHTQLFNNSYLGKVTPHAREAVPAETPWEQRCDTWAKGSRWLAMWGPAPDEPGCQAPAALVDEAVRKRAHNGALGHH
jgi:uncharacterized protein YdaU (DUF1376 family)